MGIKAIEVKSIRDELLKMHNFTLEDVDHEFCGQEEPGVSEYEDKSVF